MTENAVTLGLDPRVQSSNDERLWEDKNVCREDWGVQQTISAR